MNSAPILADQSLAGMVHATQLEPAASGLDLSAAVRREGWESVVLETDEWIVRFPRDEQIDFDTELAVLAHVAGRLPVRTPEVSWTGQHTRCMAYPKLVGTAFTLTDWDHHPERHRALARSLAGIIAGYREAFSPDDRTRLGLQAPTEPPMWGQLAARLDTFDASLRPSVSALLGLYTRLHDDELDTDGTVPVHGDFHLGNLVLDGPCGPVVGLWDFSCVGLGVPSTDLHYLVDCLVEPDRPLGPDHPGSPELFATVRDELIARRHQTGGLRLAEVMLLVEWICDHDSQRLPEAMPWLRTVLRD